MTTAKQIKIMAQMLMAAEGDHNKEAIFRYTQKIGELLNKINQEAQAWANKENQK